ncbi:MAG: hypothetical protein JXA71_20030 [Chitinispirillaceae bacterium]|nr:hypothetical protein [Chitinispirillaceae bacterium]
MLTTTIIDDATRCSRFSTAAGFDEHFCAITTDAAVPFNAALDGLVRRYDAALSQCGLSDSTAVFSRLFVSDILNRKDSVIGSPLFERFANGAISLVEQKPLVGGPLALLSYHIANTPAAPTRKKVHRHGGDLSNTLLLKGRTCSLFVTANATGSGPFDAASQTKDVFESIAASVSRNGLDFRNDAIRTWVFVRDIDNHYTGMVDARREFFARHGLNDSTRYLASTGIGGSFFSPEKAVSVDSLSIGGLAAGQIVRMEAPGHLSPTILYGVTFERGLRVRFGDRSHLHISGTASIDRKGEVLYRGDAEKQAMRTLDNIHALLVEQGASINDLAYLIVYIRDRNDKTPVEAVLKERVPPATPCVITEAPVCRPSWLVEIEGMAIIPDDTGFPPFL